EREVSWRLPRRRWVTLLHSRMPESAVRRAAPCDWYRSYTDSLPHRSELLDPRNPPTWPTARATKGCVDRRPDDNSLQRYAHADRDHARNFRARLPDQLQRWRSEQPYERAAPPPQ